MAETCGVCGGEESRRGDEILFCDGCDVGVHLGCYGVEDLPADDEAWYCDACASEAAPRCGVCRGGGGALKRAACGAWAHVCCALWTPELFVGEDMGPCALSLLADRRDPPPCDVCGRGGGVACAAAGCGRAAHASCALASGGAFSLSANGAGAQPFELRCAAHASPGAETDEDASLALARRLQAEEDAAEAADSRARPSAASSLGFGASPSPPRRAFARLRKGPAPEVVDLSQASSQSFGSPSPPRRKRLRKKKGPEVIDLAASPSPKRRRRGFGGLVEDEAELDGDASSDEASGSDDDAAAARDSLINDDSDSGDDGSDVHRRVDLRRSSGSIGNALGRGGGGRVRRGGVLQAALQHRGAALDFEAAFHANAYEDTRSFSSQGDDSRYLDTDDDDGGGGLELSQGSLADSPQWIPRNHRARWSLQRARDAPDADAASPAGSPWADRRRGPPRPRPAAGPPKRGPPRPKRGPPAVGKFRVPAPVAAGGAPARPPPRAAAPPPPPAASTRAAPPGAWAPKEPAAAPPKENRAPQPAGLTSAQRARIEANKQAALLKRRARQ